VWTELRVHKTDFKKLNFTEQDPRKARLFLIVHSNFNFEFMKRIALTIAGSLLTAAVIHAQTDTTSTGTVNQQRQVQNNQYRTDSAQTGQRATQQYQNMIKKSQTDSLNNNGSQGTVSGSTPYDTTGMPPPSDNNSGLNDSVNNKTGSTGMSGTQPTGDGSGNSGVTGAGTSGTTGTGPTGTSTSGEPGRPRYEGTLSDSKDRKAITTNQTKKATKKKSD
jgi:hypothetical protein